MSKGFVVARFPMFLLTIVTILALLSLKTYTVSAFGIITPKIPVSSSNNHNSFHNNNNPIDTAKTTTTTTFLSQRTQKNQQQQKTNKGFSLFGMNRLFDTNKQQQQHSKITLCMSSSGSTEQLSTDNKKRRVQIIIAGAPASGKGTQCEIIKSTYGCVHLSTGDILREAVAAKTTIGIAAKEYMDSGKLVPDDIIIGIVCLFYYFV
jgi:Adenylate kinase